MKTYLDKLRPFERRLVVGVMVTVFAVLNVVFVFPHFNDWGATRQRLEDARAKLAKYNAEIAQSSGFEKKIKTLEGKSLGVPPEEQRNDFTRAVLLQAGESRVNIITQGRMNSRTNQFFVEQSQSLRVQSGEDQLVSFLYNLGNGNSQIRVKGLAVQPDQPRQSLSADVTLGASYQKKLPTRATTPAPAPATPAKPSTPLTSAK
jgi:hypothetical protein